MMKLATGSDHGGYLLKDIVNDLLQKLGHQVIDVGTNSAESCDYPDFAKKVADTVASGKADLGILICGTGLGMSMAANKVAGIRAAVCCNEYMAKMARAHNDANIICIGERVTGAGLAAEMVKAFLDTAFEGDRHARRVGKINALD